MTYINQLVVNSENGAPKNEPKEKWFPYNVYAHERAVQKVIKIKTKDNKFVHNKLLGKARDII